MIYGSVEFWACIAPQYQAVTVLGSGYLAFWVKAPQLKLGQWSSNLPPLIVPQAVFSLEDVPAYVLESLALRAAFRAPAPPVIWQRPTETTPVNTLVWVWHADKPDVGWELRHFAGMLFDLDRVVRPAAFRGPADSWSNDGREPWFPQLLLLAKADLAVRPERSPQEFRPEEVQ